MAKLRAIFPLLLVVLALALPSSFTFAQTATPTPTSTPDYRTYVAVGSVQLFAGTPPSSSTGWLVCDGSAVSRTTYANLFAAIGTTFGAGDGSTTFNLPDMRGRVPVGSGAGAGLTARTLGQTFGEETHTLTITEMPSHNHGVTDPGHSHLQQVGGVPAYLGTGGTGRTAYGAVTTSNLTRVTTDSNTTGITVNNTGGGVAFNQMQPSIVMNYIIWSGSVALPNPPDPNVVVTVVVVFPTHTSTPTPTPTLTPTTGPSPTPTFTPSPTGLSPYETVTEVNGQPVLFEYKIGPGDAAIFGMSFVIVGLILYALFMQIKRRRG